MRHWKLQCMPRYSLNYGPWGPYRTLGKIIIPWLDMLIGSAGMETISSGRTNKLMAFLYTN